MSFHIVRQDITKMDVDAVVNAANTSLRMGGGVCGAIFKAAGANDLKLACEALAPIKTGEACITPAFKLKARHIIHTAGPVYDAKKPIESEELLKNSYLNSLKLAADKGLESIAFPLISSGIYGYPRGEAFRVASRTIRSFLEDEDMEVSLVLFDRASFLVAEERLGKIDAYIDENYVKRHSFPRSSRVFKDDELSFSLVPAPAMYEKKAGNKDYKPVSLSDLIGNLDASFSELLFRLIDAKGMNDVEVYKRANMDRKHFSKIKSNKAYRPSKSTVLALALALKLDINETEEFLKSAGYALSHSVKFDVIVEYFIINQIYDIFEVNEALFEYDQTLLGA